VYMAGTVIERVDKRGKPVRDNNFLTLFNAHHEKIDFLLPEFHAGGGWQVVLDTAHAKHPFEHRPYEAGANYPLEGRSMALLIATAPHPALHYRGGEKGVSATQPPAAKRDGAAAAGSAATPAAAPTAATATPAAMPSPAGTATAAAPAAAAAQAAEAPAVSAAAQKQLEATPSSPPPGAETPTESGTARPGTPPATAPGSSPATPGTPPSTPADAAPAKPVEPLPDKLGEDSKGG
jgi:hypothetical protein